MEHYLTERSTLSVCS